MRAWLAWDGYGGCVQVLYEDTNGSVLRYCGAMVPGYLGTDLV